MKRNEWFRIVIYRTGEVIFFLLIAFYFTGGFAVLPASWIAVFDANPKILKKLLTFAAGGAVILGLALFEWARRDKEIGSRSLLARVIETWKCASNFWIVGFFVLFGSWWAASSLLRHFAFKTSFDMAIFTQAVWNTTQGDWFYSSIKGGICLLGDHFAPLLAVFAVPYKLWPEPGLLLAIQAFSAAASVFPLARIVRRSGQSASWAVLYCLLFALYLPLRHSVRFDFHPEVAAMPLLFWAFVFLEDKRLLLSTLFLTLVLLAKESIATVTFGFGLYACLKKPRHFGFGIFWMLASVVYFFWVTNVVIPHLSGAPYFYLDANFASQLHGGWGAFLKHLCRPATFKYLGAIFGPLAFTSFLAPVPFVLALPTLIQNILARPQIIFQYTAMLTPFVFIASAIGLAKIRFYRRYCAYLLLTTSVLIGGYSEVYYMRRMWIEITPHTKQVDKILRTISPSLSLRTHELYAPHSANRKELHIYENDHPKEGGSWKARHTDLVAIDRQIFKGDFDNALNVLKRDGYQIDSEEDGFFILKKAHSS